MANILTLQETIEAIEAFNVALVVLEKDDVDHEFTQIQSAISTLTDLKERFKEGFTTDEDEEEEEEEDEELKKAYEYEIDSSELESLPSLLSTAVYSSEGINECTGQTYRIRFEDYGDGDVWLIDSDTGKSIVSYVKEISRTGIKLTVTDRDGDSITFSVRKFSKEWTRIVAPINVDILVVA